MYIFIDFWRLLLFKYCLYFLLKIDIFYQKKVSFATRTSRLILDTCIRNTVIAKSKLKV